MMLFRCWKEDRHVSLELAPYDSIVTTTASGVKENTNAATSRVEETMRFRCWKKLQAELGAPWVPRVRTVQSNR